MTQTTEQYVLAQVEAGAQAIQLFDSWAGLLARDTYREFALRYAQRVLTRLAEAGVPRIYFPLDGAHLLSSVAELDAEVIGLDWRLPLDAAARQLGPQFAVQGNLDPSVLLAPPDVIRDAADRLLQSVAGRPGHIFNLGHGVLKQTPVEHAIALVESVKELSRR